jgi:hypothetical protein
LVERRTCNAIVIGSIPVAGYNRFKYLYIFILIMMMRIIGLKSLRCNCVLSMKTS